MFFDNIFKLSKIKAGKLSIHLLEESRENSTLRRGFTDGGGGGSNLCLLKLISSHSLNIIAEREPYCSLLSRSPGLPFLGGSDELNRKHREAKTGGRR
jgi:hypothetical protein